MTWKLWKVLSCQDASTTVMPCGASVSLLEMESSSLSCGVWWETHFHSSQRRFWQLPCHSRASAAPAVSKIAAGKSDAPRTPNRFFSPLFFWREKKGKCQEEIFCVLQLFIKGLKAHVNWEWNIKVQLDAHACFWPVERKEYFHGAQRSGLRLFLSEG